jgi:hypothetical protein
MKVKVAEVVVAALAAMVSVGITVVPPKVENFAAEVTVEAKV